MVGKQDKTPQLSIFDTPLKSFINLKPEFVLIEWINKTAKQEGIILRQTHTITLKRLMIDQRFHNYPKRRNRANLPHLSNRNIKSYSSSSTNYKKRGCPKSKLDSLFFFLIVSHYFDTKRIKQKIWELFSKVLVKAKHLLKRT